ncbi:MAG TPA: EAL domain-containing protein [Mycobacteriales bacterium]
MSKVPGGAVLSSVLPGPPAAWVPRRTGRIAARAGFALALAGLLVQAATADTAASTAGGAARVGTIGLAALLSLLRAALIRTDRAAWALLGLGLLGWTGGGAVWTAAAGSGGDPGTPSAADIGHLAFYPFTLAAVWLLVRSRAVRRLPRALLTDGVTGALALGSVAVVVVGPSLARDAGGSVAAYAVRLAYPVLDVVLIGLVVLAVVGADFRERAWWVLGAASLLFAAVDVARLAEDASGRYVTGDALDVLWSVSAVVFAAAAWQQPVDVRRVRLQGWTVLAVPVGSVVAALAVLASRPPLAATELAVAAVAIGAVRATRAVRRSLAATEARDEAVTDDLTGLANRRLLLRRMDAALADTGQAHALVLLDLDRFKEVNDTLGHPVGDELLRQIGPRLARTTRPGETVARLGGDEFAVLLPAVGGEEAALRAARRVLAGLLGAFVIDGLELFVSASAGIAVAPAHGSDGATLLRKADVAMYQSKRAGSGPALYRVGTDPNSRTRLESATALRRAIGEGQLVCHYQPQVDVATGVPLGLEALARWDDPRRGLLPPEEFLELAEQAGLMGQLFDAVLRTALDDCRRWRHGLYHLRVAVNLAATSLQDGRLAARIAAALRASDLPAAALTLEISDGGLLDTGEIRRTFGTLHAMGVRVSLDDYGDGRSSVGMLRELPVDQLKLDGHLVGSVTGDRRGRAIVRHTVLMAHALGIEAVAEGVEDAPTLRALDELGCDYAQGYHIAPPLPPGEVAAWLAPRVGADARTAGAS